MIKIVVARLTAVIVSFFLCTGCSKTQKGLKVAATAVPHAQMLEFVKHELKEKDINLMIIVTDDYNMPNRALVQKEIDANFFQHVPFLEEQIRQFHYRIQNYAAIEIEPMGIYSSKIQLLLQLNDNAVIAIPNDPTNEGRALLLLQSQGLIKLKDPNSWTATLRDITSNPKNIKFIEVDAAMLPRSLSDVDAAVINTNYALQAHLDPREDALALESKDSPYVNIIAIRDGDEERPDLIALKEAMTSHKMREFIIRTYKGAVVPAF